MKRRVLSSKLIIEKVAFFILMVTLLLFCVKHYPEALIIGLPLLVVMDYLIYYRPNHVEFDDDRMFVKRKKGEEVVLLKDIYQLKITRLGVGSKRIWKIKYSGGAGIARCYPRLRSPGIVEFVNLLQLKNPGVEINV